ncbi:MAG: hypothetical protein KDM81_17470, partial [Verrucomicrobiae bacterium]|nr:hypothetical protein [Verrucomicrobiae bacterium]
MPAAASNLTPALVLAAAVWLAPVSPAAAGLPEPDTILYGKVFHRNHIYELVVTEGELEWIIR